VEERVGEFRSASRLEARRNGRHDRRAKFGKELRKFWKVALDDFDELIACCAEFGDLVARSFSAKTNLFAALELLRTRAVQVAWEVRELAEAGYADGAFARWRTLHELAVVAEFLNKFGEDAAERYLKHVHIKNRKVVRDYNECCDRLGYPRISQTEVDKAEETKQELIKRYGPDFGNEWGWAADACRIPSPSFFDLRRAAGYAHWKAHFGMANHGVHAGPHGVLFRLGHPLNATPVPLSGPSLVGLGTPIDTTAGSLMHVTFSFASALRQGRSEDAELELELRSRMQFIASLASEIQDEILRTSKLVQSEFGEEQSG
jgi:hypothetical protein